MVKPIPDGYEGVTPYLIVEGAARAIDFYRAVFDAVELFRIGAGGDRIGHAELKFGQGIIMLADPFPEYGALAPVPGAAGASVSFTFYCPDVDDLVARAVAAGAVLRSPAEVKFYGDRMASLVDPFGHVWHVATHVEDVSPDELERRAAAQAGG
ncbi:VOC family protein [Zavarzinia compransoris]|uniref:Glyoxalase n=1 Tax=Zavarzinia compransoris TaxID=1264899 RepID=A0A317DVW7_9PROT|nr:VOC family protein [Zavarzinia compransoris]PWR18829.1 glyoxalase [Zavarzinia compransoris]TDP48817.1 PhnB protein [Zavarzinia compransoris]